MQIKKDMRCPKVPTKPMLSMIELGLANESFVEVGFNPTVNIKYLATVKPNTIASGLDLNLCHTEFTQYKTVFSSYAINYMRSKKEIDYLFSVLNNSLAPGGLLVIVSRSIAEVKGNTKRTGNWKYDSDLNGFVSDKDVFQKGYDTVELDALVKQYGFEPITKQFNCKPTAYTFTIARKK